MVSGWMSVAAALLHLGCIVGGADWYRFLGAGEKMAHMAERGHWYPPVITLIITAILAGWAGYAFSAAGNFIRLPLMRTALLLISAVLLIRAFAVFIPSIWAPEQSIAFRIWSSTIVLVMGFCFATGTWRAWSALSRRHLAGPRL